MEFPFHRFHYKFSCLIRMRFQVRRISISLNHEVQSEKFISQSTLRDTWDPLVKSISYHIFKAVYFTHGRFSTCGLDTRILAKAAGVSLISAGNLASWGNMTRIEFTASPTLALLSVVWIQCIFKIVCYYRKLLCNCVDCLDEGYKDPREFVQLKVLSLGAGEMAGLVKCHRCLRGWVGFLACR